MKMLTLKWTAIILMLFLVSFLHKNVSAQTTNSHKQLLKSDVTLQVLKSKIEHNPNDGKVQTEYIDTYRSIKPITFRDSLLTARYDKWIVKFPFSSVLPLSLGRWFHKEKDSLASIYLAKALKVDSSLAEAWYLLSLQASIIGDTASAISYARKGINLDKKSSQSLLNYAHLIRKRNPIQSDSIMYDISINFPNSEDGMLSLFFLATNERNLKRKVIYYDQILKRYSKSKSVYFRRSMAEYFSMLINQENYDTALALSFEMINNVKLNLLEWRHKAKVASELLDYENFLSSKNYVAAINSLDKIIFDDNFSNSNVDGMAEKVIYMKAHINNLNGQTDSAFKMVLSEYKRMPSDMGRKELIKYSAILGKDTTSLLTEIWNYWVEKSVVASNFSLKKYDSDQVLSLSDLRGKVVLLTFWFPTCSPCRFEFPHLENVIKKFDKDEVAYVGINGVSTENGYVAAFMKNTGYSFIPLKNDSSWESGNLETHGYPNNFLIDQKGKIVFSKFIIGESNEDSLRIMISELLARHKGN